MFTIGDVLKGMAANQKPITLTAAEKAAGFSIYKVKVAMEPTPAEKAARFKAKCQELGVTFSARNTVVSVRKTFKPGDVAAYSDAESDCYSCLALVPASGGSTWGTDSGSIGGHVGCQGGYCTLNKSGVKKRFISALLKK